MRTFFLTSCVAMLLVAQGCSDGDSGGGETGGGAGLGAGGKPDGRAGSGGVAPAAGKGGMNSDGGKGGHGGASGGSAGTDQGGGGAGAEAGQGGVCDAPVTANMPWLYELRVAGGGGEGGASGTEAGIGPGGDGGSGGEFSSAPCTGTPQETGGLRCEGIARVRVNSLGTRLIFSDGSSLLATSTLASEPFIANETVWVRYEEEWLVDCPFCGGRTRSALEIRTGAGGALLNFSQGGERRPATGKDRWLTIRSEIFGDSLASTPGCSYDFEVDCYRVHRTLNDYELATTPAQAIPHAVPTRVVTAAGETFDVLLSSGTQTSSRIAQCEDGRSPPEDATFIVSRVHAP